MAEKDLTQVRRAPEKQTRDQRAIRNLLDRAIVAHVAVVDDGQAICIPVACAPFEDELLLHGSTASRLFRLLANGASACVTITNVQALVLARTAFDSSLHYQSLVAFGVARVLDGEEKVCALNSFTDHLFPMRRSQLRDSTKKELAATSVLSFPLTKVSMKVSDNLPENRDETTDPLLWIGVLPISSTYGKPIAIPDQDSTIATPDYISGWPINRI